MKIAITGHRPERIKGHEKEIYEWFKEKFCGDPSKRGHNRDGARS